ncbi:PREDICTED: interleukin-25 [Lipotes vexillifer]|uniref:Interleukin-25 n=1 Tax=Lipotes vexillifer TaxID=118797 RepID=A0A340WPR4_LIPVE|nr:PREDICTED: interleukin-25 [Lipotes vexillifer]
MELRLNGLTPWPESGSSPCRGPHARGPAVAFLAMVLGTHTLHLWLQKGCAHWPSCCPSKGQNPTEEWLKGNTVLMPPPETTSLAHHPESCKASEDGPLNSRSIAPWRYELDRDLNWL